MLVEVKGYSIPCPHVYNTLTFVLVEKYEEKHWKIDTPDPVEAIKYRMQEMGLKQKDVIHLLGSKSKVSEVLIPKRIV